MLVLQNVTCHVYVIIMAMCMEKELGAAEPSMALDAADDQSLQREWKEEAKEAILSLSSSGADDLFYLVQVLWKTEFVYNYVQLLLFNWYWYIIALSSSWQFILLVKWMGRWWRDQKV